MSLLWIYVSSISGSLWLLPVLSTSCGNSSVTDQFDVMGGSATLGFGSTLHWLLYTSSTLPTFVSSRRKWKHTTICLLLPCITGFCESLMAGLLSHWIIV